MTRDEFYARVNVETMRDFLDPGNVRLNALLWRFLEAALARSGVLQDEPGPEPERF